MHSQSTDECTHSFASGITGHETRTLPTWGAGKDGQFDLKDRFVPNKKVKWYPNFPFYYFEDKPIPQT